MLLEGEDITHLPASTRARRGLGRAFQLTNLFPNLSAEANIVIQTKENALIIPREYLIEDQYVMIDSEERVEVEVGLMDYQHVEIINGLNEGQLIYKP